MLKKNAVPIELAGAPVSRPNAQQTEQKTAVAIAPTDKEAANLPGEAEWPVSLREALKELLSARKGGKAATYAEIFALGRVKAEAEKAGQPYLGVCQQVLKECGEEAHSEARISSLTQVYEYLAAKGIRMLKDLPSDLSKFPPYSLVAPLYKFIKYPKKAEPLKTEWDRLHAAVFDPDPSKRPAVEVLETKVNKLFAPPAPKGKDGPPAVAEKKEGPKAPSPQCETIKADRLEGWFKKVAPKGELRVFELRVVSMSPANLAAAIKASWADIKACDLIRPRVGK